MKKNFNYGNPLWAFIGALLFLLVFSWSTSPLYRTFGGDSPFFQIIGLGVTQGKVPYVDLYDHKGPMPFFMDALGYSLGLGRLGLFIIQVLSMTVAMRLFYRIARLFTKTDRTAFFSVVLALIALADFITEGNQVEEWELPYVALTLYFVCRYILRGGGPHSAWLSLLYGLCFGAVFYTRPNDGVMWTGSLVFGLLLMWLVRGEWRRFFANLGAFLGGCALVSAPIFWYFSSRGAVSDFLFGMITYNIRYATDIPFTWGGIGMIIIPLVIVGTFLLMRHDRKEFRFVLLPMLVFTLVLIGKRDYYHYLIPLTPFVAMCFAECLQRKFKVFLWIVCVLFAIFSYREWTFIVRAFELNPTLETFYEQTDELFEAVPEEERNTVWNYNLVTYHGDSYPHLISLMGVFPHAGLTPSSPILAAYDLFYLEETHGIKARNPKWAIVYPEDDEYTKDLDWIRENYELVAASPAEPVCSLELYRRK